MELKLSVSIGATLQVKNARGEWDWIKPEVGCEVKLIDGEIETYPTSAYFTQMWDDVVGPQFANVVRELIDEQTPEQNSEVPYEEDLPEVSDGVDATETVVVDEIDEY